MRGTVLLLDARDSTSPYTEHFRANGLMVYTAEDVDDALQLIDRISPDVVVYRADRTDGSSVVSAFRDRVDRATSIIVAGDLDDSEHAHNAGADSMLAQRASLTDILNEVHRALILRRTGRRLPWNQAKGTSLRRGWWTRSKR